MKESETKNSLIKTSDVEQTIEQSELISNENPTIRPSSKVDSLSNINKKNKQLQNLL